MLTRAHAESHSWFLSIFVAVVEGRSQGFWLQADMELDSDRISCCLPQFPICDMDMAAVKWLPIFLPPYPYVSFDITSQIVGNTCSS